MRMAGATLGMGVVLWFALRPLARLLAHPDLTGVVALLGFCALGGVVYLAQQEEPVRRPVALKLIKLGLDTKSVIARFEAERQALAMMDHPNIANARVHPWPPRHRRSGALQGPDTRPS